MAYLNTQLSKQELKNCLLIMFLVKPNSLQAGLPT